MVNKKLIIPALALIAVLAAIGFGLKQRADNRPTYKIYRVGILVRGAGYEPAVVGFRQEMFSLGYVEGQNISYDVKFVSTKEELEAAAQEFVGKKVDLIHTYSTPATQIAYKLTKDLALPIPVVFGSVGDPLLSGVVKDIQRPGMNVTGIASLSTQLTAKRLELLKQINPAIRRVAMPHTAKDAGDVAADKSVEIARDAAANLGIELVLLPVRSREENAARAKQISKNEVEGVIVGGDSLIWGDLDLYIKRTIEEKLPLAVFDLGQVRKGGLIGFGPDYRVVGEQAAVITHQILRGKNPGDIPVKTPERLVLAVNLKTAKAINVKLPDELLSETDILINE